MAQIPSPTLGFAAYDSETPLKSFKFDRRAVGADDVKIKILYSGVCHSDLHTVNGDWGPASYPLVPGHEIVGRVEAVGESVTKFAEGDIIGVGCFVDSCRTCSSCKDGFQQYCETGATFTYGSPDKKSGGVTQGGYSTQVVVDQNYILKIPKNLPLERVAPLLCAGITTYSPLRHWKVEKGQSVGVAGLGGLGHMAVKFARAMGAKVTVFSTSASKKEDALKLGAHDFAVVKDENDIKRMQGTCDLILNAISANHDYNLYLNFLKRDGTMVLLGLPDPQPVSSFNLVRKRRSLAGSLIGGIPETQEMLDFCGKHEIAADVEVIAMDQINDAYKRMVKGDVYYRFVIDMATLK